MDSSKLVERHWIIGPTGQVGGQLVERLGARALRLGRGSQNIDVEMDFSQIPAGASYDIFAAQVLDGALKKYGRPAAVINATAYNQVDRAETDQAACLRVNVEIPQALARWCARDAIPFVQYSTDFVYSGAGAEPWRESDPCEPINFYGQSKLQGEQAVSAAYSQALILRTAWVYSHRRENFVLAILERARTQGKLTVVLDQIGHPTSADSLAEMTLKILTKGRSRQGGVYNLANSEAMSRFEFAERILQMAAKFEPTFANVEMFPALTASMHSPAPRPLNTRLNLDKIREDFEITPTGLTEGLSLALRRIYASRG